MTFAPLNSDPLPLVQVHVVIAPIVQPRGTRGLMRGNLLRNFQLPAVLKIRCIPVARNVWFPILF